MAGEDFMSQVLPAAQQYAAGNTQLPSSVNQQLYMAGVDVNRATAPVGGMPEYNPATMGPIAPASGAVSLPHPPALPPTGAGPAAPGGAPPPASAPAQPPPSGPAGPPSPSKPTMFMTPGHAIPAHEFQTVGPTTMALWNEGEKKQEAAQMMAAEGHKTAALHTAMQAQADKDAALQQEQRAQAAMQARQQHLMQVQEQMNRDADALGKEKDFGPRGTNLGEVLAVALGGFAHGFSGGKIQNLAWDIVRKRMDDDVAAKAAAFGAKRASFDAKQRQFNNLVQTYGMDPAKDMWAAAQRDRVAADIKLQAASSSIPEIQAAAEAKMADMQGEADKFRAKAFVGYQQASATGPTYGDENLPGVALSQKEHNARMLKKEERGEEHGYKLEEEANKQLVQKSKDDRGLQVKLPDGRIIRAGTAPEATEIKKDIAASESVKELVGEVKKLRQKLGWGGRLAGRTLGPSLVPKDTAQTVRQLQEKQTELMGAYKEILGTLQEGEQKRVLNSIGNVLSQDESVDASLDSLAQIPERKVRAHLRTQIPDESSVETSAAPIQERQLK